jgi:hypothetical protein
MFAFSRLKTAYCAEKIIAFLCDKAMRLTTDITNAIMASSIAYATPSCITPSLKEVLLQLFESDIKESQP